MDSSKVLEGSEECSSNESGWTMYIASSPDQEHEHADNAAAADDDDEDGEDDMDSSSIAEQNCKRDVQEVDSDDSMASDASSGPTDQGQHLYGKSRVSSHAANRNERKYDGKKKQHDEHTKAAKGKSGNRPNSAGKSKKR